METSTTRQLANIIHQLVASKKPLLQKDLNVLFNKVKELHFELEKEFFWPFMYLALGGHTLTKQAKKDWNEALNEAKNVELDEDIIKCVQADGPRCPRPTKPVELEGS